MIDLKFEAPETPGSKPKLTRIYDVAKSQSATDFKPSPRKIGAGLVADTQTAVLFNLTPEQATKVAEGFGLPPEPHVVVWKSADHFTNHVTGSERV